MNLLTVCNICGGSRIQPYAISFDPDQLYWSIGRCTNCGIYFANPMASEADLEEFYSTKYYKVATEPSDSEYRAKVKIAENQLLMKISPHSPAPGSFLEIGCGYGPVLSAARNMGYATTGIELGDIARAWASERQGLKVLGKNIELCGFENAEFDVIYSWHVIEHMPDMARFLRTVHRILKPGGIFFFGTENYRSIQNIYSRAHH